MRYLLLILGFVSLLSTNIPPEITYNSNHQPLVIEYTNGEIEEFTYDNRGRLQSRTAPNGETISYTYDGVGNITRIENPTQTIEKTYDALNRLKTSATQRFYDIEYDAW